MRHKTLDISGETLAVQGQEVKEYVCGGERYPRQALRPRQTARERGVGGAHHLWTKLLPHCRVLEAGTW